MMELESSEEVFREELIRLLHSIDRKLGLLVNKAGVKKVSSESRDEVWEELMEGYTTRRLNGVDLDSDRFWITSEKNLARCKRLGLKPEEVLEELRRRCGV